MEPVKIGQRIKNIRQRNNLTLKDIESRVAVSATHVSEIERGRTSPTVGALGKIAEALGVDPAMFLTSERVPLARVNRAASRERVRFEGGHYTVEPFSEPVPTQVLSAAFSSWDPLMTDAPSRRHAGEEFGYIVSGRLELESGGRTFYLEEGDTIHFRTQQPHRVINRGNEPCTAIWVTSPKFGF